MLIIILTVISIQPNCSSVQKELKSAPVALKGSIASPRNCEEILREEIWACIQSITDYLHVCFKLIEIDDNNFIICVEYKKLDSLPAK